MTYRVLYKRFSEIAGGPNGGKGFLLVEESINAVDYNVGPDGTLTFYKKSDDPADEYGRTPFFTIPPTFWFIVEPADKQFSEPQSSLVKP